MKNLLFVIILISLTSLNAKVTQQGVTLVEVKSGLVLVTRAAPGRDPTSEP